VVIVVVHEVLYVLLQLPMLVLVYYLAETSEVVVDELSEVGDLEQGLDHSYSLHAVHNPLCV
jgi:hypothetical protein